MVNVEKNNPKGMKFHVILCLFAKSQKINKKIINWVFLNFYESNFSKKSRDLAKKLQHKMLRNLLWKLLETHLKHVVALLVWVDPWVQVLVPTIWKISWLVGQWSQRQIPLQTNADFGYGYSVMQSDWNSCSWNLVSLLCYCAFSYNVNKNQSLNNNNLNIFASIYFV